MAQQFRDVQECPYKARWEVAYWETGLVRLWGLSPGESLEAVAKTKRKKTEEALNMSFCFLAPRVVWPCLTFGLAERKRDKQPCENPLENSAASATAKWLLGKL